MRPIPDASIDLALFSFSLHHIPSPVLPGILREVRRVLRSDGFLYVAEPLAEGPAYEVSLLYRYETEVRWRAAETLSSIRRRTIVPSYNQYIANMMATIRYNDFTEADLHSPAVKDRFKTVSARVGGVLINLCGSQILRRSRAIIWHRARPMRERPKWARCRLAADGDGRQRTGGFGADDRESNHRCGFTTAEAKRENKLDALVR